MKAIDEFITIFSNYDTETIKQLLCYSLGINVVFVGLCITALINKSIDIIIKIIKIVVKKRKEKQNELYNTRQNNDR